MILLADRDKHGYGSHGRYDKYDKYGSHHSRSNGHRNTKTKKQVFNRTSTILKGLYLKTNSCKRFFRTFYFEEGNFLETETAERVRGEWGAVYRECSAQDQVHSEMVL